MKRNQFLLQTLAGAAALFAGNWGTRAEIRQYKIADKPLLTEANLNRLFTKWKSENNMGPFEEAMTDAKAFLEKYFSVSPRQKTTMRRLKPENWQEVQSIIKDARDAKGTLNFKFITSGRSECSTQVLLVQNTIQPGLPNQPAIGAELRKVVIQ